MNIFRFFFDNFMKYELLLSDRQSSSDHHSEGRGNAGVSRQGQEEAGVLSFIKNFDAN